jgi:hypothetical protein
VQTHKCQKIWATQFLWVEMLKNKFREIVKCIVYSFVKGKDIILGLKFDMLEQHVGKKNQCVTCHKLARRKVNFISKT